ncbi:hypothetical protein [Geodermatophilus sp. DSM 44513]|uniref:hypothetical protein n=1 Tax=Geodermatophilus sp. DSM 44513 TaxID=1528104 RepID=UPI001288DCED|nr:hypothetical protein [Geodermatophilus sp. DSM 44513]WNV75401.1 hypothetical protein RTG05_20875 [Geodermatophilus sp. DSM 44513]
MSEPQPATGGTGPGQDNLVDGVTGEDRPDGGERDEVTLTTDDEAQDDHAPIQPGNS